MDKFVVGFLADVLVYIKNIIEHEEHLFSMFQALREISLLATNKEKNSIEHE